MLAVCRYMNWSWSDYNDTPVPVIEQVMLIMEEEQAERERQRGGAG